ncbi:MAG TPA: hypothetical protein DCQ09_00755 [Alcanivorax sp.]|nr:hypothetical protein [Alcanivorax sp.]
MTEQQITDFDRWFDQFMDPEINLTPGDKELCRHAWQAALSHAEGEPVGTLTIDNYGSDEFRALLPAMDLEPGTYEVYTHPAPQVAGLTETAIKSSPAYRALHREKEHLLGLLKDQAPQVAVPEGFTVVPVREFYVMSEDEDIIGGVGNDFEAGKHLLKLAQEGDPEKAWGLVADIDQTKLSAAPTAPAGELVTRCTAGLGCDEKGYCDAAATGQGDLCDRRTMAHEQPVSDPDGLEQVLDDLRKLHTEMTNADLVHEGSPEIVGYCVTGKQLDRLDWLLTCAVSAGLNSAPAPDEREIAALREDADRYRFWREVLAGDDKAAMDLFEEELNRDVAIGNRPPTGEELDKAVDVARRLRAGQEGE